MKKIKEFQSKHGLNPDGLIGKKTLAKMKQVFGISNNVHLAHFLGQIHHETKFEIDTENLNYSAKGLGTTFKKYFPTIELANKYANKPILIANKVYANRMGNGDELSGDGWKYRGRGAIQLTGKSNYKDFEKWLKLTDLNPDDVADKYYWETALFFFEKNKIFSKCTDLSEKTITTVSKIINGGTNGLEDRISKTKYYYSLLNK